MKVVIYQMGRVGSVSVRRALVAGGVKTDHVHYMASAGEHYKRKNRRINDYTHIISIVRDPLARNISEFLRRIKLVDPHNWDGSKLVNRFMRDFNHMWPFIWWDSELKRSLDWDIFEAPFNKSAGHHVYDVGMGQKLLVLQTERLRNGHTIIGNFLGVGLDPIPYANTTDMNQRGELRQMLLDAWTPLDAMLDMYYTHKSVTHFYTSSQITAFRKRWQNTPIA